MKPDPARVRLTYDDFLLFPDDGKRHELIDGEHYVTPAPNARHQLILGNLYFLIRAGLEDHPVGQAFLSPVDVVFTSFDVVEPDLLFISRERAAIVGIENVTGAPDVVVEIGSTSTRRRDETIKLRLYERAGVAEYWIVDPDLEVVWVYSNREGQFGRPVELRTEASGMLTSPHLEGLEIPLRRIFAT
jgi:Uma2 family endonuclease